MNPNEPLNPDNNYSFEGPVEVYKTFDSKTGVPSQQINTLVFRQDTSGGSKYNFIVSKADGASVTPGDYYAKFNYKYENDDGPDTTKDKNFVAKFTIKEDR